MSDFSFSRFDVSPDLSTDDFDRPRRGQRRRVARAREALTVDATLWKGERRSTSRQAPFPRRRRRSRTNALLNDSADPKAHDEDPGRVHEYGDGILPAVRSTSGAACRRPLETGDGEPRALPLPQSALLPPVCAGGVGPTQGGRDTGAPYLSALSDPEKLDPLSVEVLREDLGLFRPTRP